MELFDCIEVCCNHWRHSMLGQARPAAYELRDSSGVTRLFSEMGEGQRPHRERTLHRLRLHSTSGWNTICDEKSLRLVVGT